MKLTAKQAAFVEEYLVDLNATQAAIRAGYSAKTAEQQGPRLLGNVGVKAAIQAGQAARSARTEIAADAVLKALANIGFASLADVTDWGVKEVAIGFDEDGKRVAPEDIGDAVVVRYADAPYVTPINRDELPPDVRSAVAEVGLTKDGFKIKMHDKVAALVQIGRHLGMWKDKLEVSTDEATAVLLAEARKRSGL